MLFFCIIKFIKFFRLETRFSWLLRKFITFAFIMGNSVTLVLFTMKLNCFIANKSRIKLREITYYQSANRTVKNYNTIHLISDSCIPQASGISFSLSPSLSPSIWRIMTENRGGMNKMQSRAKLNGGLVFTSAKLI